MLSFLSCQQEFVQPIGTKLCLKFVKKWLRKTTRNTIRLPFVPVHFTLILKLGSVKISLFGTLIATHKNCFSKTLPVEYVRTLPEKSSQDNRSTSMARDQSDQSKQPLCMDQYTAAVSTYRRCGEDSDTHIRYSLNLDMEEPTHVIVAYKGEVSQVYGTVSHLYLINHSQAEVCAQNCPGPDRPRPKPPCSRPSQTDIALIQTQARSNPPMIRLKYAHSIFQTL